MYQLLPGKSLRYYQENLTNDSIAALSDYNSVCIQLSTGGGKTLIASAICARFLNKYPDKSIVLTFHEGSLLASMRRSLYDFYGIIASIIDADTITPYPAQVYVCMAQTLQIRIQKPSYQLLFKNIGLLCCDEVHRGEHRNIEQYFKSARPDLKIIGLSATPKNATPKDPLKNHYEEIVVGASISELIAWNKDHPAEGLVQNITVSPNTGVTLDRSKMKRNKKGEYDDTSQGDILKTPKYTKVALEWYNTLLLGKKTIIFNSSIEHSEAVNKLFCAAGLPSRHLDGKNKPLRWTYDKWRLDCMRWMKVTEGAILHNCGVVGTGYDETSIEAIMINKLVGSMPHLLQMEGRGGRPHKYADGHYKLNFYIVDLYGNNRPPKDGGYGDWSDERDWRSIFLNPKKSGDGVAPSKHCPMCGTISPASMRVCLGEKKGEFHNPPQVIDMIPCRYIYPEKPEAEEKPIDLKVITKGVNVAEVTKLLEERGYANGKYGALYELIRHNAQKLRREYKGEVSEEMAQELLKIAIGQTKEWCQLNGHNCTKFFKNITRNVLFGELKKLFPGFEYGETGKEKEPLELAKFDDI